MKEREQLEQAIAAIEAQRSVLGDSLVEAALKLMAEKLATLDRPLDEQFAEPASDEGVEAASFTGERRVITILFCDVKGSTAMAEQLDPEEWAGIIQRALEYLTEPVRRHGGTVAEVRGDGILAFFGAPVAHEDDPQRAVLAGLEILESIEGYRERLKRVRDMEFNVRVGIHTGLVVVGDVGTEEQVEYTAIGDTVNLAARMEQTAQPGTVQISEQTYRLVEQIFQCEPLGKIKVKGKRQPVRAYRVNGLKAEPGPVRGLERQGIQSRLVGREAEFAVLTDSLHRLLNGSGSILTIEGEAGIGKSRLIMELHHAAPAGNLYWLEGHTLSYGHSISYWPFQEILRGFAGITNQDGEDIAWGKLEGKIKALFPDNPAEILPYLASLLGLKVREAYLERVKYLDGEALGKQVFLASRRFFERLAVTRPLVLVFEDLHWMDESSASLLEHLLPLVESVPLLILGLTRSDTQTPATYMVNIMASTYATCYTDVRLASLSQGDSDRLMHNLLEIENLPGSVHQMIVGKADGNPFFLEEILRTLIDLGAIVRDPSTKRWRSTTEIENLAIPDTVQGVIIARIDRLEDGVKQVLRLASVIGRSFLHRLLSAVVGVGERLDEHLAELQRIELIQEKQHTSELEYLFKHALAHEAVYGSMLLQTRRELHYRVGQAIEKLFADRLEEYYSLLAHHYAKAEAWEKAQAYLLKAADQAGRMAADAEALRYYQQALAAYAHAFGDQWNPVERAALERKIGEAVFRQGEYEKSYQYSRQALAYLGRPIPDTSMAIRRAILWEITLQLGRRLLPRRFPVYETGPAEEEEFRIYQTIFMQAHVSEFSLFSQLRMLNFCQKNGFDVGVIMASSALGMVLGSLLNLPRLAEHYIHQAVTLAGKVQTYDVLGYAYVGQSLHEISHAKLDSALAFGERAVGAFQKAGSLVPWMVSLSIVTIINVWHSNFARALAYAQELTQSGLDSATPQVLAAGLALQGHAEQHLGRLDEAIIHLQKALEIADVVPDAMTRAQAGNLLGQCYLCKGDWQTAMEVLEENRRFIDKYHIRRQPARYAGFLICLARAYLLAAEKDDPVKKNYWLMKAGVVCRSALKWGNAFRMGHPEALRLQGRLECLRGNASRAQRWWLKSLAEAEMLRMRYELGLTHLEIGQRLSDRPHLEKAGEIFAMIGAELDLARSRELIENL